MECIKPVDAVGLCIPLDMLTGGGRVMRLHFHFADKFALKSQLPSPCQNESFTSL